jgi:hypothetical protein
VAKGETMSCNRRDLIPHIPPEQRVREQEEIVENWFKKRNWKALIASARALIAMDRGLYDRRTGGNA